MKDDVISRQAAIDALGEEPEVWLDGEDEWAMRNQWRCDVDAVKAIPAVDVIRPVRCHDCKYVSEWRSEESAKKFGQVYECMKGILNFPDPNDFCSRGDRREQNHADVDA